MDIRLINYFISVYEQRSFTKAAEKMHVVQPALSMQIRNLEGELGTALFERTPRGAEPTAAGRRFYELCIPIARDLAAAKQAILDLVQGDTASGSIRVGLPSAVCRGILSSMLNQFTLQYPGVDISIVEAYSRYLTEQVRSGELDLALGAKPTEPSGLASRLGFDDRLLLVSGQPINGNNFTPCDLSRIKNLKLLVPSDKHLLGVNILDCILCGEIAADKVMRIDGFEATMEMARASDWGAICPVVSVLKEMASKELYIYPIVAPKMRFDLYVVYDPRRPLSLAGRRFVDMLEHELAAVIKTGLQLLPQRYS